jgi:hypothetical protein
MLSNTHRTKQAAKYSFEVDKRERNTQKATESKSEFAIERRDRRKNELS